MTQQKGKEPYLFLHPSVPDFCTFFSTICPTFNN